ncbi:MAG: YhcH/YjgK/YiaL family protein [Clostridia bacterium]|nr:YhcH/YjgK/YiaL family protein [Clostridia bacterium]
MIIDTIENVSRYENVHPRFARAFTYLKSLLDNGVADGHYEPENPEVPGEFYVNIGTGDVQPKEMATAESHRKYIDLQLVLAGEELMCVPSVELIPPVTTEYKPDGDYMLYAPVEIADCHQLRVTAGQFVIFLATELHAPSMAVGKEPVKVRKAILKVLA